MPYYEIIGPNSTANPLSTLQVGFNDTTRVIPAVYCSDLFADQIENEQNDPNSNFYSATYGNGNQDGLGTSWKICPNMTNESGIDKDFQVIVYTCTQGKKRYENFEPNITCIEDDSIEDEMGKGLGFKLARSRVNSNFVPSLYHSSKELQYYVTQDQISMRSGTQKVFYTDVYLSINNFMSSFFLRSDTETVKAYTFVESEHFAYTTST